MSTVVRPSGPLPSRVYWVRRLLLLLIVVALVSGVTQLISSVRSDEQAGAAPSPVAEDVAESPSPTATPTFDDEARPSKREQRRANRERQEKQEKQERREKREKREASRVRTVNAELPSPEGPCDLTQVSVLPAVQPGQEAEGAVDLRLSLSTSQPMPCSLELDADRLLLSITADDEPVWSTTRCRGAIPAHTVALRPFWTTIVQVSWTGQLTSGHCSPAARFATPGQYQLQTAVLTGEPATTEFTLLEPPPPPRPPKPEGDETGDTGAAGNLPDPDPDPGPDADAEDVEEELPAGEPAASQGSQTGGAPEPGDEELSAND